MKKIIHLSDIHVGYGKCGDKFARLVRNIILKKKPSHDYLIIITGDLVEDATDPDSFKEVKRYIDRLEGAGFKVLIAPGNHDYGNGIWGEKKYVQQFKWTFFGDESITYPKLDIIEDCAFIALDSLAAELHWYDTLFWQGELGNAQLARLKKILKSKNVLKCKKRVIYFHHHPDDPDMLRVLRDAGKLKKILSGKKIDALLFGHQHGGRILNGMWGIPRCYDGGTSTRKAGDPGPNRIIDLSKDPRYDREGNFYSVKMKRGICKKRRPNLSSALCKGKMNNCCRNKH